MFQKISTPIPELTLRFAQPQDVPLVYSFIEKLAEFEKRLDQVVVTETTLHEALFGERPVAEVIFADYNDEPVGFALFFHTISTFSGRTGIYIEDLFVDPDMRGKGIGRTMLTYFAKLVEIRGGRKLEWTVLDWNEPAINFYQKLGAHAKDEWTIYQIDDDALHQLAHEF
jgi:GNAT superfamily N-acetyltransferase